MVEENLSASMNQMRSFIADFERLRSAQRQARREKMGAFLSQFAEQQRRFSAQKIRFNVFSLLQVETDEVRHSRFMTWLLDPMSGHGQGTAFLKAFARACRLESVPDAPNGYRVRTEFTGMESIVDVMVCPQG